MLAFAFQFWMINKYAISRGRISPAWGFSAVISLLVVLNIMMPILFWVAPDSFLRPGLFEEDPSQIDLKKLHLYSAGVSLVIVSSLFFSVLVLKEKVNPRSTIKKTFINYKAGGWLILLGFGAMILIAAVSGYSRGLATTIASGIFFIAVAVTACFRFHRQSRSPSLVDKLSGDKRGPVLLLRSFDDAKRPARLSRSMGKKIRNYSYLENRFFGYTFDEIITDKIDKEIGPVVALGDPGDYLPALGSAKLYIPDSNDGNVWWDAAKELIDKAQLIIVIESAGENVQRELDYIRNNIASGKVIFVTYPKIFKITEGLWSNFRKLCEKVNITLPEIHVGEGKLLTFDNEWNISVSTEFNTDPTEVASFLQSYILANKKA
jgi:hypothetical protein